MIVISKFSECLNGLVGFKQNVYGEELAPELLTSKSGLYVQEAHELLTMQNISLVAPLFSDFENYDLSKWLKDQVNTAKSQLITKLIERQKIDKKNKTIIKNFKIYEGSGMFKDKIVKLSRLVGLELKFNTYTDLKIAINQLGVQLVEPNPDFKIYLYNESFNLVKTISLSFSKTGLFEFVDLPEPLNFSEGIYYLLYNEDELQGQAISRNGDLAKFPCFNCGTYNPEAFKKWSEYFTLKAVSLPVGTVSPNNLTYHSDTNFGLNFQMSVECDITQNLCNQKIVFANALQLQIAIVLLNKMKYNTRDNAEADNRLSSYAIDALGNNTNGITQRLDNAISVLQFDLSDFDSRCFSSESQQGSGYVYGAV